MCLSYTCPPWGPTSYSLSSSCSPSLPVGGSSSAGRCSGDARAVDALPLISRISSYIRCRLLQPKQHRLLPLPLHRRPPLTTGVRPSRCWPRTSSGRWAPPRSPTRMSRAQGHRRAGIVRHAPRCSMTVDALRRFVGRKKPRRQKTRRSKPQEHFHFLWMRPETVSPGSARNIRGGPAPRLLALRHWASLCADMPLRLRFSSVHVSSYRISA
jgi:hypothetical protein